MRLEQLLAISILLMTAPAYASVDFSAYEPTLDKLHAESLSFYDSSYTMSFKPISKTEYDSSAATGKFVSYEDSGGVFSPVYYLYSYAPKYDFSTYTPTLNKADTNKYGHSINSLYSVNFAGSSTDYDFVVPVMVEGVLTPAYHKISYVENLAEAGNKASVRVTNSGVLATDIVNHFAGFSMTTGNGVIVNSGSAAKINNIIGDFAGNQIIATGQVGGVAISNDRGNITNIIGDFIGNHIITEGMSWGGAIYSFFGELDNIVGNFIGNYVKITIGNIGHGGAVYTRGNGTVISSITGDFIGNYVKSVGGAWGGAVGNEGEISKIRGNFIGNYVTSDSSTANGGAIYNRLKLGQIDANFIGNYAISSTHAVSGGAVHSDGSGSGIDYIRGDFIGNYAISNGNTSSGGALYNSNGVINEVSGDFIDNYIRGVGNQLGGALYNSGSAASIALIQGKFIGNNVTYEGVLTYNRAQGGAVYNANSAKIGSIKADFINNYVLSESITAVGGAIYTSGSIDRIQGDFIANYAKATGASKEAYGGAIQLDGSRINEITGKFVGNYISATAGSGGGAINLQSAGASIGNIDADFINNYVQSGGSSAIAGGAIRISIGSIGNISGQFINNSVKALSHAYVYGGAIFMSNNAGAMTSVSGEFIGNNAYSLNRDALGGAIYNVGGAIGSLSSSFRGNYVRSDLAGRLVQGGAIYSKPSLVFKSAGKVLDFTDNYTNIAGTKTYNAVFLETQNGNTNSISFDVKDGGSITFNDEIRGGNVSGQTVNYNNTYDININGSVGGDGEVSGETVFNASVVNVKNVNVTDARLTLGSYNHGDTSFTNNQGHGLFVPGTGTTPIANLNVNNSVLKMSYDTYQELRLNNIISTNNSSIIFGANFETGTSDKIYAVSADSSQSINLRSINLTGSLSVGQQITLFSNTSTGYLGIGNIGSFTLINGGRKYDLSYNQGVLTIANDLGLVYPIYVASGETVGFNNTNLNGTSTEGVIVNDDTTTVLGSEFSHNSNSGNSHSVAGDGGVILNGAGGNGDLEVESSKFEHNSALGNGGAIANLAGGKLAINNSSFDGNQATGKGGAVYSADNVSISATSGYASKFANNQALGVANDIYIAGGKTLSLTAVDDGSITFDGGIDGDVGGYAIEVGGNDGGNINLNSAVKNVSSLKLSGGNLNVASNDYLKDLDVELTGGYLNYNNGAIGNIAFNSLTSSGGLLGIKVDPSGLSSDLLSISGDVVGTVNLVVNTQNEVAPADKILFASTPNASSLTDDSFKIYRVAGSPFNWDTSFDDAAKKWYLGLAKSGQSVASEVVPYIGLVSASFEQTRSLLSSIKSQTDTRMASVIDCRLAYNGSVCNGGTARQAWVSPVYYGSHIGNPVSMNGTIGGLDAGFDLQRDLYNKIGVFASYRRGDYELNGHGQQYFSPVKSDLFIDSYLGGLYYRRDVNNYWLLSSVYGGMQRTEVKTRDGVRSHSEAYQFGGNVELGYSYYLTDDFSISPSLSVAYNHISLGKMRDIYGKEARYGEVRQVEVESGVRFEKLLSAQDDLKSLVYIKPSLVKTFTEGDDVYITGLGRGKTYHDQVLGKLEVGGQVSLREDLTAYGNVFYTGGSKYRATAINIGITYKW